MFLDWVKKNKPLLYYYLIINIINNKELDLMYYEKEWKINYE